MSQIIRLTTTMAFNLDDMLVSASISKQHKFNGLINTLELKDTIRDLFSGSTDKIIINNVEGRVGEFRANLLHLFQQNTLLTLRKSTIRNV